VPTTFEGNSTNRSTTLNSVVNTSVASIEERILIEFANDD
jgi:hypothetical protein